MVSSDASNAALAADCPADLKASGGQGSIAEQIAASRIDIVLGGGQRNFAQPAEGETTKNVRDLAVANGFRLIGTLAELESLAPNGKVLGLFSPGTMPVQWRGVGGAQAQRVQRDATGRIVWPDPFACEPDPNFGATPPLRTMTSAAIAHLDGRGFVLMVESASIDKQSHVRRPCGSIGELKQLDDTLKLALAYAAAHPETLVLVTADHGQAAQLVPETSWLAGLNAASPGHFARISTPEGGIMGVNYATNDSTLQEDHTGTDIPLFAYGAGASEIPASIRQTDVFDIMLRHLGLEQQRAP
jgi:alkaline phosphatase